MRHTGVVDPTDGEVVDHSCLVRLSEGKPSRDHSTCWQFMEFIRASGLFAQAEALCVQKMHKPP